MFFDALIVILISVLSVAGSESTLTQEQLNDKLLEACWTGDLAEVKNLVSLGADIDYSADSMHYGNILEASPVRNAANQGNIDVLKFLVGEGADVFGVGSYSFQHPLILAARRNKVDTTAYLLELDPSEEAKTDALTYAVMCFADESVKLLRRVGVGFSAYYDELTRMIVDDDVEGVRELIGGKNYYLDYPGPSHSPLMLASGLGRTEIVRLLIEAGADTEYHGLDDLHNRPLAIAVQYGRFETVKALVELGADVNAGGGEDEVWTPLGAATEDPWRETEPRTSAPPPYEGHPEIVQFLIDSGADVEKPCIAGQYTPLAACGFFWHNAVGEARVLLENGAKVHPDNPELRQPLKVALQSDCFEVAELLVAHGADVNRPNKDGYRPVQSTSRGRFSTLLWLVDQGADPLAAADDSTTLLINAAGRTEFVIYLIEAGADVNAVNHLGSTPLLAACKSGNAETIRMLLDAGAEPDVADWMGDTPLHFIATREMPDMLAEFVGFGLEVNARDTDQNTPLHRAASACRPENVKLLLESGAEINARDKYGRTPLFAAATNYYLDWIPVVQLLLDAGADVTLAGDTGLTTLHEVARFGPSELVERLLELGADVDAANESGYTPLHFAAAVGKADNVGLLLQHGADPMRKNSMEQTALDMVPERVEDVRPLGLEVDLERTRELLREAMNEEADDQ